MTIEEKRLWVKELFTYDALLVKIVNHLASDAEGWTFKLWQDSVGHLGILAINLAAPEPCYFHILRSIKDENRIALKGREDKWYLAVLTAAFRSLCSLIARETRPCA